MSIEELNNKQLEVIKTDMPILNIAGPGSGKTKTMIEKILTVVSTVTDLDNMLIVTFTNNATNEIISRIEAKLGEKIDRQKYYIGTFHAIFYKFLNENKSSLNIFEFKNSSFKILTPNEDLDIFKTLLKDSYSNETIGLNNTQFKEFIEDTFNYTINDLYYFISKSINNSPKKITNILDYINENLKRVDKKDVENIKQVVIKYFETKYNNNLLSFSDILLYGYLLLYYDENIRNKIKNKFKYILVDEFQDTNLIQFNTLELIFNNNNYYVVGDPYQSIYKFLGAYIQNIINMSNDTKNNVIQLNINYRSTKNIVDFTNDLTTLFKYKIPNFIPCKSGNTILKNKPIQLREFVIQENVILEDIEKQLNDGIEPNEIAIIMRSNYESAFIEKQLLSRKIFYKKLSGKGFYELPEVVAYLSVLKFLVYNNDVFSFRIFGVHYPKLGATTINKVSDNFLLISNKYDSSFNISSFIKDNYSKNKKLLELIKLFDNKDINMNTFLNIINNLEIKENIIKKASTMAKKKEIELNIETILIEIKKILNTKNIEKIKDFLETTSLNNKKEDIEENQMINITTAHSSKGLEWRCVYILNATNGKFPSSKSTEIEEELEEEKRLFYVAVSRAKDNLMITSSSELNSFVKPFINSNYSKYERGEFEERKNIFFKKY